MPFMEMTVVDNRKEFILHWKADQESFSSLCQDFGISRPTGYKWVERYKSGGMENLQDRDPSPHEIPNKTPPKVEQAIIEIRKKHKLFGPKKIRKLMETEGVYSQIPAHSTISLILKRNGLIKERKKRKHVEPQEPIFDPDSCNQVWSADYKGKFKMGNGRYCYPLTICDSFSRYILAIKGLHNPNFEETKPVFIDVFKDYGLPLQLHTDNGSPFASIRSLGRITRFAVWLMELGIQPVYSDPASPQQNGRHERMHRELKAAACNRVGKNLQAQQRKMNEFMREYNEIRPHEALGMEVPKTVHEYSNRSYPKEITRWEYPAEFLVKHVCGNGNVRSGKNRWIPISTALSNRSIGLEELGEGIFRIWFRDFILGYLDESDLRVYDIHEFQYVPKL